MQNSVDPTQRFSTHVGDYVRARPSYPEIVLDYLADAGVLTADSTVADVGAGTGISAALFLGAGHEVYAVEPNAAMRTAAEQRLGDQYSGFHAFDGRAEATTLADDTVDLVVTAQALHWFDLPAFHRECRRILRPGGALILLYNTRCNNASSFMREYEELTLQYGRAYDYQTIRHENFQADTFRQLYDPTGYHYRTILNPHVVNRDQLVARACSSSYLPGPDDPQREPMIEALDALFTRHCHDNHVIFHYKTELYWGCPR